ncbi:MAG: cytochrome c oxidase subunit 3 [Isosphaeraceae bacterium]
MSATETGAAQETTTTADPLLYHHFDDLEQQNDTSILGMWAFLATEVMFFGGLFVAYALFRHQHWTAFVEASRFQNVMLGAVNTSVLLTSSLTMAMAVRSSHLNQRKPVVWYLIATMVLGSAFLGIKGYEYHAHYEEHLAPGVNWDWEKAKTHGERSDYTEPPKASPLAGANGTRYVSDPSIGEKAKLYYFLYFFMTGLHAFHMVIGLIAVGLIAYLAQKNWVSGCGATHIEVTGLYWHFIDVIWVFLYPLLYLIEPGRS